MVRALENLALLGNGVDYGLQRRAAILRAEAARLDFRDDCLQAATNGAEVLEALLPEKPALIGGAWVVAPPRQQVTNRIGVLGVYRCHCILLAISMRQAAAGLLACQAIGSLIVNCVTPC